MLFFVSDYQDHYPWLQLHFESNVTVHRVAITNRYDIYGRRFQNLTVNVGFQPARFSWLSANPLCASFYGPSPSSSSIVLKCSEPRTGTYLLIQQKTPDSYSLLSINEVYVCGN